MVSVIVPIYNVENYVKKCLDSLAAQTLEDVEFILIDDGSTDSSGRIADQYSSDSRFHVFHTENRGLSAARNYGIDQSHGEYIMFVDGDDWVDLEFCKIPYETAIKNKADLIIFQVYHVKNGKIRKENRAIKSIPTGAVDDYIAIRYGGDAAWNKLYKRDLFESIRYPEGRVYEDIATTHKLVHDAKCTIIINNSLYYYAERKGSITKSHTKENLTDRFVSSKEKYDNMTLYGYPEHMIKPFLWAAAIRYVIHKQPCNEDVYLQASQIVDSISGIPKQITLKHKAALVVWKIDKALFCVLCKVVGRLEIE